MKNFIFITPLGGIFSISASNQYIACQKLHYQLTQTETPPLSAYYYLTRTCGYAIIMTPIKKIYTPPKMTSPQKVMLEKYKTRRFY